MGGAYDSIEYYVVIIGCHRFWILNNGCMIVGEYNYDVV